VEDTATQLAEDIQLLEAVKVIQVVAVHQQLAAVSLTQQLDYAQQ